MSKNYELIRRSGDGTNGDRESLAARRPVTLHGSAPSVPQRLVANKRSDGSDFDIQSILQTIRRRRGWLYGCTAAMLALAALVCIFLPRQYKAQAKLEIFKQDTTGLSTPEGANPGGGSSEPLDFTMTLQTQVGVLESDILAWQVMREAGLVSPNDFTPNLPPQTAAAPQQAAELSNAAPSRRAIRALNWFHWRLKVEAVPGTRLITVSYLDHDPKRAAKVVNQLLSDFVEYNFRVHYDATTRATAWLGQQLVELKSQAEQAQQRAVELQKESGILGEDESHNVILSRLEQLNSEVTAAQSDRVIKENIYRLSRTGNPELIASMLGTPAAGTSVNPNVPNPVTLLNTLRQQEATLNAQYADASAKYGPAYPRLIQIKQQLNTVRSSILDQLHKVAAQAKSEYEIAASREAAARNSFAEQKAIATHMNDKAIDYTIAKQEADSARTLYENLLHKVNEAGVLAGLKASDIHIVDPAAIPVRPAMPNIPLYLLAGAFVGMIVGLGCVFTAEALDRTVRNVEEVEANTYVPVLGVIPQLNSLTANGRKHRLGRGLAEAGALTAATPDALLSARTPETIEAFRSACASLLWSQPDEPAKVILVTSGMAQEGKTFASLNFAASLARNDTEVLLVDADLRRRTLSKTLGQDSSIGFSQALCTEADIESVYRPLAGMRNVVFLPAGAYHAAALQSLESEQMAGLMAKWRQRFRYVVIDTPPVLPVTDAAILSLQADAVIVVVRFGVTNLEAITRTIRVLKDVRAPRINVLINAINLDAPEYHNYFGSYGYYDYNDVGAGENAMHAASQPSRKRESA